ncbi:MAG: hypothetical protein AAF447_18475, partial [Myxococcota bacterium]
MPRRTDIDDIEERTLFERLLPGLLEGMGVAEAAADIADTADESAVKAMVRDARRVMRRQWARQALSEQLDAIRAISVERARFRVESVADRAVEALVECLDPENHPRDRINAAKTLLNRAGLPEVKEVRTGPAADVERMSDRALFEAVRNVIDVEAQPVRPGTDVGGTVRVAQPGTALVGTELGGGGLGAGTPSAKSEETARVDSELTTADIAYQGRKPPKKR